ncbi:MAG: hypothetical protein ACI9LA_002067 [Bacteroidia bacterium]|jgi:hypothetical protein
MNVPMKILRNILIVSICVNTIGFLLDTDPPVASVWLSIFEFVMMVLIVFGLLSVVYFTTVFIYKKLKQLIA